jgi:hypothetical protein
MSFNSNITYIPELVANPDEICGINVYAKNITLTVELYPYVNSENLAMNIDITKISIIALASDVIFSCDETKIQGLIFCLFANSTKSYVIGRINSMLANFNIPINKALNAALNTFFD